MESGAAARPNQQCTFSERSRCRQIELELQLFAQPISDLRDLVGDRLTEFCGDLEAFKLVRPSLPETAVSKRQVGGGVGELMQPQGARQSHRLARLR